VDARSKGCTVFYRSNSGIVGLKPKRDMMFVWRFFLLRCPLWALLQANPLQGILPNLLKKISETHKTEDLGPHCYVLPYNKFVPVLIYLSIMPLRNMSRDSIVGMTDYGVDDRWVGVRVPVGSKIFSSSRRPDRLWGPPTLLSNGYRGIRGQRR
jgi:hypothetical protein